MSANLTNVGITEEVTKVTVSGSNNVAVAIGDQSIDVKVNNFAIPIASEASAIDFSPYGSLTATNVSEALKQLADQNFRTTTAPTGSTVDEGDIWYDTDDNELKVYRETSTGVFQWVPIMVGAAGSDSDTVDAGAF